ncbi:hypothetical protein FE393_16355 [Xenorhabdus sp. psl]|nr:hypothetical protein [Xenorhabdus sp. psl]
MAVENLNRNPVPLSMLSQYLPEQAEAVKQGRLSTEPKAWVMDKIRSVLLRYANACERQLAIS